MITFNDFVHKHNLRNKATSNIKLQQVLNSIGLNNVGIYLRDGPFSSDIGIVSLHPSKKRIGLVILTKNFLIHMVVSVQRNYLNLLYNEMVIVCIQNIKYKKNNSFCAS